jgi:hypothetical protein
MRGSQPDVEDGGVGPRDEQAEPPPIARRSRALTALRYGAPLLAAIALVLVLGGDGGAELDSDLHVYAPHVIARASTLPLRALLYTRLRAIDGPTLAPSPAISVRVETQAGRMLARSQLRPARAAIADAETTLALPDVSGSLRIVAQARHDDRTITARATVEVRDALPARAPEARPLRALQQMAAGPIIPEPGAIAPSLLDVQVRGGACVPETPCRVLVHVGEPSARVSVEKNSAVTPSAAAERGSDPRAAVVELEIVSHGPEAELWLHASRDGHRVARRSIRLPIAMAAAGAQTSAWLIDRAGALQLSALAADGGCIVDLFRHGHWSATGSLAHCRTPNGLPFALPPGLSRIQLRTDPFSERTAGVAVVYLRREGESNAAIAASLARSASALAPDDALVRACDQTPATCDAPSSLAYLAAILETGIDELPQATSGYAASLARTRERQTRLRNLALIALALAGLSLISSIGRSGFVAGRRASHLFQLSDPPSARRARLRSLAVVSASLCSLTLVFIVIALYVLARAGAG